MCELKRGDIAYLVKGGKLMFGDGRVYRMSECKLSGGKIVLGMRGVSEGKVERKEGVSLLGGDSIDLGEFKLKPMEIELVGKEVVEGGDVGGWVGPFLVLCGGFLWVLKKLGGLDRELRGGSCELRHREAIVRIAKLEGKVLRKSVVDGGKVLKKKVREKREKGLGE